MDNQEPEERAPRQLRVVEVGDAIESDASDPSTRRRGHFRVLGDIEIDLDEDPVGRIEEAVTVLLDDGQLDPPDQDGGSVRFRLLLDTPHTSAVAIDVNREENGWRVVVDPMTLPNQAGDDLAYRATHDLLTGLANRAALNDRARVALERAERTGLKVALLFLDLDRFKRINDSLGHSIGDDVLVEVASRLERVSRPTDLVARLGGDEFAILCEDIQDARDAAVIAERVLEELRAPLVVGDDDVELAIGSSIGIALVDGPVDIDELLRRSDQALLRAKVRGRARYEFHDHAQSIDTIRRLEMERQLRAAIGLHQLRLEYQPILSTGTRAVDAVEALLRWDHPELGTLTAGSFIDVANETGLIVPIGRWVIEEACAQLARWDTDAQEPPLKMHVNVSGLQLLDQTFSQVVRGSLEDNGIGSHRLVLEVDEAVLSVRDSTAMDIAIARLIDDGVDFAIDHYGLGYGAVANLGRLPVPMVKIDKSFVVDLETSPQARAVVRALLDLASAYDLATVVEGVETLRQYQILELLGCDACQGHVLGSPMRPKEVTEWLASSARDSA